MKAVVSDFSIDKVYYCNSTTRSIIFPKNRSRSYTLRDVSSTGIKHAALVSLALVFIPILIAALD